MEIIAAAAGVAFLSRHRKPGWPAHLSFPIGQLCLLVPLYWIHVVAPYCHYTHTWTNRMLLAPLAAGALHWVPPRRRAMVTAAVAAGLATWTAAALPGLSRGIGN